jgi:hypothetical protein
MLECQAAEALINFGNERKRSGQVDARAIIIKTNQLALCEERAGAMQFS